MNTTGTLAEKRSKTNIRTTVVATLISAIMAVALPQILHTFGIVTGLGTMPGETYLPMHLPVILCG